MVGFSILLAPLLLKLALVHYTTHTQQGQPLSLHVEYAERRRKYGILFIFSLFCEYIDLEYVRVPVIYRVNQAEYVIHIRVAASQEYLNRYSARRPLSLTLYDRVNPNPVREEAHLWEQGEPESSHTTADPRGLLLLF